MLKRVTMIICMQITTALFFPGCASAGDQYAKLLKKQGYNPLTHPRSNFGVGTIIPLDKDKQLFIAGPAECFPGLDSVVQIGDVKLLDSHDDRDLNFNLAGKYSPSGSGFLAALAGAFGFSRSKTLDVKFGETKSIDLTQITFERYMKGKKVPKDCITKLQDPKVAVIFSMARVAAMSYQFKGTRGIDAKVDVSALQKQVELNGGFKWDHNNTDTFTIKQPMYVGYVAYTLKDLKFDTLESGAGESVLREGRFTKINYRIPE
jgi:hypothetical protein